METRAYTFKCHCGHEITTTVSKAFISCLKCTHLVHSVWPQNFRRFAVLTQTQNGFINYLVGMEKGVVLGAVRPQEHQQLSMFGESNPHLN